MNLHEDIMPLYGMNVTRVNKYGHYGKHGCTCPPTIKPSFTPSTHNIIEELLLSGVNTISLSSTMFSVESSGSGGGR